MDLEQKEDFLVGGIYKENTFIKLSTEPSQNPSAIVSLMVFTDEKDGISLAINIYFSHENEITLF